MSKKIMLRKIIKNLQSVNKFRKKMDIMENGYYKVDFNEILTHIFQSLNIISAYYNLYLVFLK